MTVDVLPTLAKLIGAELPAGHVLDGKDVWPLLAGEPGAKSPHEALYFYWGKHLHAVRSGNWKLHFPHNYPAQTEATRAAKGGTPAQYAQRQIGLSLFDLEKDPGETSDVAKEHPDVVGRLTALAEVARRDLGDIPPRQ